MTERPATILHADLDAFYASVEQLLDPRLAGVPIAVGGGVVLAASYEARAFGVRGGMPGRRARQLCPHLRFVGGHFREYQRLGDAVMDVFTDFTPLVERISIDEAFLDVTGSVHLFGPPEAMGAEIRRRVREELGLPISVGVASTKHLAKVASQVAKPDGMVVVAAGAEAAFLDPLPVGLLWGVGPATRRAARDQGHPHDRCARGRRSLRAGSVARSGRRFEARGARGQRRRPPGGAAPTDPLGRRAVGARPSADRRRAPPEHVRLPRRPRGGAVASLGTRRAGR